MKGTIYGVGVGPGDPELITVKAVRIIQECEAIAVPGENAKRSTAYSIALRAVPAVSEKELLSIDMPMTEHRTQIDQAHERGAEALERVSDNGKSVAYLTLGDPCIYSTFGYLHHILESDGYPVEIVSGVTSFCAAAARLGIPLVEGDEALHVIPALHDGGLPSEHSGSFVFMKAGHRMKELKELLQTSGMDVSAVLDCGMERERIYRSLDEIPDDAGYFALMIARESRREKMK